uniref:Putative secreted protein n=1 Tax=Anopheles triannulatus TaxID=58253 RepID=A0A2M4B6E8_9DIPT
MKILQNLVMTMNLFCAVLLPYARTRMSTIMLINESVCKKNTSRITKPTTIRLKHRREDTSVSKQTEQREADGQ